MIPEHMALPSKKDFCVENIPSPASGEGEGEGKIRSTLTSVQSLQRRARTGVVVVCGGIRLKHGFDGCLTFHHP
jgi:hypothetical protein